MARCLSSVYPPPLGSKGHPCAMKVDEGSVATASALGQSQGCLWSRNQLSLALLCKAGRVCCWEAHQCASGSSHPLGAGREGPLEATGKTGDTKSPEAGVISLPNLSGSRLPKRKKAYRNGRRKARGVGALSLCYLDPIGKALSATTHSTSLAF